MEMRLPLDSPPSSRLLPGGGQAAPRLPIGTGVWRALPLAAALLWTAGCGGPEGAVAKVEGEWITAPRWQAYLKSRPGVAREEALKEVVRREVAWNLARKQGILRGPAWEVATSKARREVLAQAYLEALPGALGPVTDEEARQYYMGHSEERQVSHVLVATRSECEAVRTRIEKGEALDLLARSLSKDPSAMTNGGELGWIRRSQVVEPFGDAVFGAPKGALVGPVKTEFGWHVARVEDVRTPSEEGFEKQKEAIRREIEARREQLRRDRALEDLRKGFPVQAVQEVLERDRTTEPAPGDETTVAGRVGSEPITLLELKTFLADSLRTSGQSHSLGPETKARFLEALADDYRLAAAARQAGLDRKPEVEGALWDAERALAWRLWLGPFLRDAQVPEADLRTFYGSDPSRFRGLGEIRLNLLIADSETEAKAARIALAGGRSWQEAFDQYANRESTGAWDIGWVPLSDLQKAVSPAALAALATGPVGSVVGPVAEAEGFALYRAVERREGAVLPFEQCRDQVAAAYKEAHTLDLAAAFLDGGGAAGLSVKRFPERLR